MAAFFNGQLLPYIEEAVNVGPGRASDPEGAFLQHLTLVRVLSGGDAERGRGAPAGTTPRRACATPSRAAEIAARRPCRR